MQADHGYSAVTAALVVNEVVYKLGIPYNLML